MPTFIKQKEFGITNDGQKIYSFFLKNKNGSELEVLNYGAVIRRLCIPDRNGRIENIVAGFDTLAEYEAPNPCFGGFIGRVANRIENARFVMDGKEFRLPMNEPVRKTCLHGGFIGFNHRVFTRSASENFKRSSAFPLPVSPSNSIELTLRSENGDQGFPGSLDVRVRYSLTDDNSLICQYFAVSDRKTPVDLTQHSYFNLSGGDFSENSAADVLIRINADHFLPFKDNVIPTGETRSVQDTPFDFRKFKRMADDQDRPDPQTAITGGYAHYWILKRPNDTDLTEAVSVKDPRSGRTMKIETNQKGLVFFTGSSMKGNFKSFGQPVMRRSTLCFETQGYPNAVNTPSFPQIWLTPNQVYYAETVFHFGIE